MNKAQTVLITGAAHGIGKHLAQVFFEKNYHVVATDLDFETLWQVFDGYDTDRVLLLQHNVAQANSWQNVLERSIEKFETIDILLNVAGVIKPGFVSEFDIQDIDFHIDTNLKGVVLGTKIIGQSMLTQGHGHIINFASLAGVAPIHGLALYSASKYAVRGFSLAIVPEFRQRGVYVSVICPDLVNTNMLTQQLTYQAAALTFSGNKILTVQDIEKAIFDNALSQKQAEILVPWHRGLTAKIGNFFPKLGFWLTHVLTKKGLQRQAELNKKIG